MAAQYHTDFGMLFAGLVLVTLPILIVYVLSPAAHRPRRHRRGTEGVNVFTSAGACVLFIPPHEPRQWRSITPRAAGYGIMILGAMPQWIGNEHWMRMPYDMLRANVVADAEAKLSG